MDRQGRKASTGDASRVPENLGIFSRLESMNFYHLPNLRSISRRALPFPSLKTLYVMECPNLRKLPLDSNSVRNGLKRIRGESEWWQGLQWKDETIQLTFTPYFKEWQWRNEKMTFSHALFAGTAFFFGTKFQMSHVSSCSCFSVISG